MFKQLFFILFTFNLLLSSEQSYPSNWRPDQDIIEINDQEINKIKNQVIKKIESLIYLKGIETIIRVQENPEIQAPLQEIIDPLYQVLKLVGEHQFQKMIDVLKNMVSFVNENLKNQINEIQNEVIKLNNICSKWLSDVTGYPDVISGIVNEYALPNRELILQGHEEWVNSVSWSPDDKYIASKSESDLTIRVWDIVTGQEISKLQSWVMSVSWSPDGKRIASVNRDMLIRISDVSLLCRDIQIGQEICLKGHEGGINAISWSPDGKYIVSGSNDKTIRIWDVETGKEIKKLKGHIQSVLSISWSPDGRRTSIFKSYSIIKQFKIKRFEL